MADYHVYFSETFEFPAEAAKDLGKMLQFLRIDQYENRNDLPDWYVKKHDIATMHSEEYEEFIDLNDYSYIDEIAFSYDKQQGTVHVESSTSSSQPFAWILSEVMEQHCIHEPVMLQEAHITFDDTSDHSEAREHKSPAGEAVGIVFVVGLDRDGHGDVQSNSTLSMGAELYSEMKRQGESCGQSPR